eukprot:5787984-Pleurochrysis_carterae.AAC.6
MLPPLSGGWLEGAAPPCVSCRKRQSSPPARPTRAPAVGLPHSPALVLLPTQSSPSNPCRHARSKSQTRQHGVCSLTCADARAAGRGTRRNGVCVRGVWVGWLLPFGA